VAIPPKPSDTEKVQEQLKFDFPQQDERVQLGELLRLVEEGRIDAGQVKKRLMVLFHTGIGGVTRALAELDQKSALEVAQRLKKGVDALLSEMMSEVEPSPEPSDAKTRLGNKSKEILIRERTLLKALLATNQELPSKDLLGMLKKAEANLRESTLTAHLDRLRRGKLIVRERKGRYRSSPSSKAYLDMIEDLIERLG
jgi:DNA-binding transcriptional ArsR family regulator